MDPDGSHRPGRRPVHQPRLVPVQRHPVVVPTGTGTGVGGAAHVVWVARQVSEGLGGAGGRAAQPMAEQPAPRGLGHYDMRPVRAQRHAVGEGQPRRQHGGAVRRRVVP